MQFMNERKKQRLPGFDYSTPGAYFVTICVQGMQCRFGEVCKGNMVLSEVGKKARQCWLDLPNHYINCSLDEYVIMPNHVHGILHIVGNGLKPFPTECQPNVKQHGLPEIIRGFKTFSSRRINEITTEHSFRWQKSYYERVIRDENELHLIRQYINDNPLSWELGKNNSAVNGNELFG
jgi:REP element-mobilizing transposase RayT